MTDTETQVIDLDKAIELTRKAVELRGRDFVYATTKGANCWYRPRPDLFVQDDPRYSSGCIVGTALELVGVELDPDLTESARDLNPHLPPGFALATDAAWFFRDAQQLQDAGTPWGEALDRAIDSAGASNDDEEVYDL